MYIEETTDAQGHSYDMAYLDQSEVDYIIDTISITYNIDNEIFNDLNS